MTWRSGEQRLESYKRDEQENPGDPSERLRGRYVYKGMSATRKEFSGEPDSGGARSPFMTNARLRSGEALAGSIGRAVELKVNFISQYKARTSSLRPLIESGRLMPLLHEEGLVTSTLEGDSASSIPCPVSAQY